MINTLKVDLGQTYFSQYDYLSDRVNVTIEAEGTPDSTAVNVVLARKTMGAEAVLQTIIGTLAGSPFKASVTFDLTTLQDEYGFSSARCSTRMGDYSVTATCDGKQAQSRFTVLPVTPRQLRSAFLFGVPLTAAEVTIPGGTTQAVMSDETIAERILDAYAELLGALRLDLEPTLVVTDLLKTGVAYDRVGIPATYYPPTRGRLWLTLDLPHRLVLKVKTLKGYFNQSQIVTVEQDWRVTRLTHVSRASPVPR